MNALAGRRITIRDLGGGHAKVSAPSPEPPPQPPPTLTRNRNPKWAAISSLLSDLTELYPSVFNSLRPRPLAVGIHGAILGDLGCDPRTLAYALNVWCRQPRYLNAICSHDLRFDLNGQPYGEVTAEQRLHARGMQKPRRKPDSPRDVEGRT
jgi:sRNA-binding protein